MSDLIDRMVRASKLEVKLFEEVEREEAATGQAMTVVVLSSLAAGLGSQALGRGGFLTETIFGTIAALIGWYIWVSLSYIIGTKFLPEKDTSTDIGETLRTTGFASAPGIIRLLGIIPGLSIPISMVASIWQLLAMVVALSQVLDYKSPSRAFGVCAVGWVAQILFLSFLYNFVRLPEVAP